MFTCANLLAQLHALYPNRDCRRGCYTCDNQLSSGNRPPIAAANNLHLAPVPSELAELNILEKQLFAKILPFAKIVSLPKGQQRAIHGAVVCVPSKMETAVNSLPRPST